MFVLFKALPSEMRLLILSFRFPFVISSKFTIFIMCSWILSVSACLAYRLFNLAIMAKILFSNARAIAKNQDVNQLLD